VTSATEHRDAADVGDVVARSIPRRSGDVFTLEPIAGESEGDDLP
jgi:hypothetical protein